MSFLDVTKVSKVRTFTYKEELQTGILYRSSHSLCLMALWLLLMKSLAHPSQPPPREGVALWEFPFFLLAPGLITGSESLGGYTVR